MTLASSERSSERAAKGNAAGGDSSFVGGDIRIFPLMHGSKLATFQENLQTTARLAAVPLLSNLVVKIMTSHCNKSEQERAQSWKPVHQPSAISLSHTSGKQFVQNRLSCGVCSTRSPLTTSLPPLLHDPLRSFHHFPVKKLDNKEENARCVKRALFRMIPLLHLKG
jgi:hypothetical protein